MSKTNENKLVPKFRFPEFVNDGEWKVKKLEDVAENVMYGMNAAAIDFDGENKYIRITDIDEDTRVFLPNPLTSPNGQLEEKYSLNVGDILFARTGASVGKSYLHRKENGKIYFAGFLIRFTIKDAVPYFVYAQTLTKKYQKWVLATSARSGQPGINAEEYKFYPILLPNNPNNPKEQQKIAACLSSLDEVITFESQKLKVLKEHKKGLLQNLFPQAGETVPKLRFKEFADSGEWVEKRIDEFAPLQRGFDLPIDKIVKGIYPVVFSNGILKYHNEYKVKSPGVVTGRSGTLGKVTYVEKDFFPHNTSLWVTDFKGNYPLFVFYYFVFVGLEKFGSGSGVPTLNRNDVHIQKIFVPSIIAEQKKIASCLSSIDDLINAQSQKVETLKLHKKGLLQGLFPKIND
jgi:type I restriction enzyme, S subunit